jgi:hypothetical protein
MNTRKMNLYKLTWFIFFLNCISDFFCSHLAPVSALISEVPLRSAYITDHNLSDAIIRFKNCFVEDYKEIAKFLFWVLEENLMK